MKTQMKKKTFTRLTAAQKRVAIAKDVLKQIAAKTTTIMSGQYWDVQTDPYNYVTKKTLSSKVKCQCCAVGAAVLSGIRKFNQDEVPRHNGGSDCCIPITYFSREQFAAIEAAFEPEGFRQMAAYVSHSIFKAAVRFNDGIKSKTERAQRIFKNIIKNNGEFKP